MDDTLITREQLIQALEAAHCRIEELENDRAKLTKAQEELRSVGDKYQNLFEYAGDSIFIIDPDTLQILDANSNAARRLGYRMEELLSLSMDDIEVEVAEDVDSPLIWESTASGTRVYESVYRCKDDVELSVEVSSRLARYGDQEVLFNFVRDVTKRKYVQEKLRQSYERLDVLRQVDVELIQKLDVQYVGTMALDAAIRLSTASAGFIGLAADGDEIRVVHAIGSYPEGFAGAPVPPEAGVVWRVASRRIAELIVDVATDPDYSPIIPNTRAAIVVPLISHRRFIGVLNLETHVSALFTPDIFDFLKLLTARVALALDNAHIFEEREQLIQELEAFAHTVAHDLKNPLSGVMGYAQALAHSFDTLPREDILNYLDEINQTGSKMANIINELLLLASVRRLGEVPLTPLVMSGILKDVRSRLRQLIAEKQAEIIASPQEWPIGLGYAAWVEEVWTNYISNAIKYGGTVSNAPRVELGASMQGDDMVRFWVCDNGPGIALEDQAKLFNQFTRLGDTRVQGHGLGLSIVQRIVDKLGGEVDVESIPGEGSTFSFTLPLAKDV